MQIREEALKDVVVLKFLGRLDAHAAPEVRNVTKEQLERQHGKLVFDFEGVSFVDSSGLGSLVSCLREVNKMGGDIKISHLREPVRGLFEVTRLHRLFEIFDNSAAAAETFQS